MPRIYLAGPWVFAPDPASMGEELRRHCHAHGLEPILPIDGKPVEVTGVDRAVAIYRANCEKIAAADGVVADITPFRGAHMDPGTAFEIGYAAALGKPVFCYTHINEAMRARVPAKKAADGRLRDAEGYAVEDFGFAENIMIACAAHGTFNNAATAIARAAEVFKTRS